jgi:glyoxylase-like metal-dependent hydrolase (beta-lactamase superfamily II)
MTRTLPCALVLGLLLSLGEPARGDGVFQSLHCFRYAQGKDYPTDAILFGTDRGSTLDIPMVLCVAKRGDDVVVLDAGYLNQEIGAAWGVVDYASYRTLSQQIGVRLEDVDLVTLSHLHWDHANGTAAFPNARFVIQRRELEFAAGGMAHNKHAQLGFYPEDVLALVKLNWEGRVLLPDGDVEDLIPGLDVYLTPGHTIATMTVCLDTVKGRVCYASDSVYTYRNIEQDIALGLGLDLFQSVESFAKIRRLVGDGIMIPGHEPRIFEKPGSFSFRRVSDRIVAIVE